MEAKVIPIDHVEQRCTSVGRIYNEKVGELCLKGDAITKGDVGNESSTNDLFTEDGWMRTEDMCTNQSLNQAGNSWSLVVDGAICLTARTVDGQLRL